MNKPLTRDEAVMILSWADCNMSADIDSITNGDAPKYLEKMGKAKIRKLWKSAIKKIGAIE